MAAALPAAPPHADDGLAFAIVGSSSAPLLLLDGDLTVIAASDSFCSAFGIDPGAVQGREIFDLGVGEWNLPRLRSLLNATLAGHAQIDAYEMDLLPAERALRRLVLNARRLDYADAANVRLLLSVSDVTDVRAGAKLADDTLRENEVLLQELQHRIANSLQIVASVLMQSARTVQSDETRSHLQDAHRRVMSVAAVQQQLAMSRSGDVALRPYFNDLCDSIGASMIRDRSQLALRVKVDDSVASAEVTVSLGLIVTELVINALKHGFPGGLSGAITVDYRARGEGWTLSVTDTGIGISSDPKNVKPGLGTSIVEALARQLEARVQIARKSPGARVSIIHPGTGPADG